MDISTVIDTITSDEIAKTLSVKKSILIEKNADDLASKRCSKAQIQWKEVPEKAEEERKIVKASIPLVGILASRGFRWQYFHDVTFKETRFMTQLEEDLQAARRKAAYNNLVQDMGAGVWQKRSNKTVELTINQQTQLELLKQRVKAENDAYLKHHPEINIMIKLVYAALFENKPKKPKEFVSDFVHHLNKHREELVVKDVDIPFDGPVIPEEVTSEEEEQRKVRDFARQIVESCVNLAAQGQSYFEVMGIIKSMLRVVSGSEDELTIKSSISNAEDAVSGVLTSLLTSVAVHKSTSAELVVDQLLTAVLSNALPFIHRDSQVYPEIRESVENFVRSLIYDLSDHVANTVEFRDIMGEPDTSYKSREDHTRSILKKELSSDRDEDHLRTRTKVKFQSIV